MTLDYRTPAKPDPARALQRFEAVHPRRWFVHPIVAVAPLVATGIAWLTFGFDALPRTAAAFFFLFSGVWLIAVPLSRTTVMSPARNLVAFYPERLAWFQGYHTQLVERWNIESYTREPAGGALDGVIGMLSDEPLGEHFTLHLQERGLLGFDYLGRTTVSFRITLPIEVAEPDAFEAALRAWLPELALLTSSGRDQTPTS
jgi:hypothetical protein